MRRFVVIFLALAAFAVVAVAARRAAFRMELRRQAASVARAVRSRFQPAKRVKFPR